MTELALRSIRSIFSWSLPFYKLAKGDAVSEQLKLITKTFLLPVLGVTVFLLLWAGLAPKVVTSLGAVPGPAQVWQQFQNLVDEHQIEREKAAAFYERQERRNAKKLENNANAEIKVRSYTGRATFFDQIVTSIVTVLCGFLLATIIAVPLGIVSGLSNSIYNAINPLVQIFKPVSPLAWLPIVTMIVSAMYVSDDPMFQKSFLNSMLTVTLCCLWPALINTAVGVANVDKDLLNVSKVLRLGYFTHIYKIVLPYSIPMIFTGLRLSFGIAWMVLIAAEMLAQNPGLGKFVWDEFQNGSSNSLGRILVAVFAIGLIGFLLDRLMLAMQKWISWDKSAELR
ncbi:MAG: ABC transporter permease [Gammaproteobacteria bacterium]|nr:ABC transporter permease [Gammaproteobacteria bacterium]